MTSGTVSAGAPAAVRGGTAGVPARAKAIAALEAAVRETEQRAGELRSALAMVEARALQLKARIAALSESQPQRRERT